MKDHWMLQDDLPVSYSRQKAFRCKFDLDLKRPLALTAWQPEKSLAKFRVCFTCDLNVYLLQEKFIEIFAIFL